MSSTDAHVNAVWNASGATEPGQQGDSERDAKIYVLTVVHGAQDGILDGEGQIYWFTLEKE